MPNIVDSRIRASYRARACAAGASVGAGIFAIGTGVCMTISLNAAYLSALPALLLAGLTAFLAQRRLHRVQAPSRFLRLLLALTLLAFCGFLLAGAVSLALDTLLPQSQLFTLMTLTLAAAALCAASGGADRLFFSVRFLLPVLLLLLTLSALSFDSPVGLFPILGTGVQPLLFSALCALPGAIPALLLFLPPAELPEEGLPPRALPGAWFFVWRVMLGGLIGVLLLFALSFSSAYKAMQSHLLWGQRMVILSHVRPRQGLFQAFLSLLQLLSLVLSAASLLTGCKQALFLPNQKALLLCTLALFAALTALTLCGIRIALWAAPFLLAPFLVLLLFSRRL